MSLTDYIAAELARFEADMEEAGFDVEHYHGRSYWHGPAVTTDTPWAVEAATTVKLQQDSLGKHGAIVYPIVSEPARQGCLR